MIMVYKRLGKLVRGSRDDPKESSKQKVFRALKIGLYEARGKVWLILVR